MAEADTIFSSKMEYEGIFSLKDFYKFCYYWLKEETDLEMVEDEYKEKIIGDIKEIGIKWTGTKEITDYFKFEVKTVFRITNLKNAEIQKGGAKIKTNEGNVEVITKGVLIKDYDGKFEGSAFKKFLRSTYEKWIIPARVDEYETKLSEKCDEFLGQAKAYLALEGKR